MLPLFRLSDAGGVDIPLSSSIKTYPDSDKPFKPTLYRKATGSLLHIANNTRPDIAYSVGHLCKKTQAPTNRDWNDVKHLWRYLKKTKNVKMIYSKDREDIPQGTTIYVDSDWAGDKDDRKSTTGYVILLAGAPISWKSKKQRSVTLSTVEAEYMALSEVVREVTWPTNLLEEIRLQDYAAKPVNIFVDNKGAQSNETSESSKHIDVRCHYVREKLLRGEIQLTHVDSEFNLADIFTKVLTSALKVSNFRLELRLEEL